MTPIGQGQDRLTFTPPTTIEPEPEAKPSMLGAVATMMLRLPVAAASILPKSLMTPPPMAKMQSQEASNCMQSCPSAASSGSGLLSRSCK